jgi:hypothetical protein
MAALSKRFTAEDQRRNRMDIGRKSARAFIAVVLVSICSLATQANTNGTAGQLPAYYEGELFIVNVKEMLASPP